MLYDELLPTAWRKGRQTEDPFTSLRKQVDHLFDDFGNGFFKTDKQVAVRSNVSETDKEIRVTAELPGLTDADVNVSVTGDRIVIEGEKKSEKEEKSEDEGREYHMIERSSGAFRRMMTLPFQIDPDTVNAVVKDGVLTVTVPKPPEAVEDTRKIKVTHSG